MMRERLARLTSNIHNPFLVSFGVIVLLAFESPPTPGAALKWAAIAVGLSVLPVFIVVVYLVRRKKLDGIFVNPRNQRTKIYLLATFLAVVACAVLVSLEARTLL